MTLFHFFLGAAAGETLGREQGREEGLEEARQRLNGPGDGKPVIHRRLPVPQPTRSQWGLAIAVFLFGVCFIGVMSIALDDAGWSGRNDTVSQTSIAAPFSIGGLVNLFAAVFSLWPLASTIAQWLASQNDDPSFRFRRTEK